ncbi:hypothetical protein HNP84_000247 [Thermocatellispora tengchongensis]|uniref:Uncharacterized protein n=1 Tax=Thermocatellispora tengchongensis TaxID=1073253 RepID=A0A840NUS7_9ACTN|nr:hypothetical protein [Thermocatellispora tengchongensis]MBB5130559.1 hypothetical protein [Thermocatellispora tengchongensis]
MQNPLDLLAADIGRLDRLSPAELAQERGWAERLHAEGRDTAEDLAYLSELEKRAAR